MKRLIAFFAVAISLYSFADDNTKSRVIECREWVNKELKKRKLVPGSGHIKIGQGVKLLHLLQKKRFETLLEVGFNAGHSSHLFLENFPGLKVTSFDINQHLCSQVMSLFFIEKYGDRFSYEIGDSLISIPEYVKNNPGKIFDVIFIDGGHGYKFALSDIKNCKKLADKNTLLLLDDFQFAGVQRAVKEMLKKGYIYPGKVHAFEGKRKMLQTKYKF